MTEQPVTGVASADLGLRTSKVDVTADLITEADDGGMWRRSS